MPDIQQRIAEILKGHRFDDSSKWSDECSGEIFCHERDDSPMIGLKLGMNAQDDWEEWVDHVAEVLVSELGLTREWGVLDNGSETSTANFVNGYPIYARKPGTPQSRYVTEWSDE